MQNISGLSVSRQSARFLPLAVLPVIIACSSKDGPDGAPMGNGQVPPDTMMPVQPGDMNDAPGTGEMPDMPAQPSGEVVGDVPLTPVDQPMDMPVPGEPPPEDVPPAVCTAAAPALEAFDCGTEGIVFENAGPPGNRVNYVIVGDGYTADMLDTVYPEHIRNMLTGTNQSMFTQLGEPYLRYRKFINICALQVASSQACIDDRDTGLQCDTAFNSFGDDASRLAQLPNGGVGLVEDAMERLLPDAIDVDWIAMTVNAGADNWWNSGGRLMLWNGSYDRRGQSASVALHEGGHAFHGLADEYGYGGSNCGTRNLQQPNVTNDPTGAKWQIWIGFNHNGSNPEGTGAQGSGPQGVFEGANYCETGYFRPSDNSEMNQLPAPFNMPSIERIIQDIYEIVDPIDEFTDNTETLVDPTEIRVRVIDPAVLKIDWSVDGAAVTSSAGECFDATGLAPGEHTVTAHVYDDTPWVRRDRADLEQTVSWTVSVSAAP